MVNFVNKVIVVVVDVLLSLNKLQRTMCIYNNRLYIDNTKNAFWDIVLQNYETTMIIQHNQLIIDRICKSSRL